MVAQLYGQTAKAGKNKNASHHYYACHRSNYLYLAHNGTRHTELRKYRQHSLYAARAVAGPDGDGHRLVWGLDDVSGGKRVVFI